MAISVPRLTVDDLEQLPEDGNRYELLDGVLLVTLQARQLHQRIARRLYATLWNALEATGLGGVVAPGAIRLPPGTQLQPDILVFPARFGPAAEWTEDTEHSLVVEVLSRSSRMYDRLYKRDAYFQLGVQQVWLVDIDDDRSVEVSRSRTEHDVLRDVIRWRVPSLDRVVPIDLTEVLAGVE